VEIETSNLVDRLIIANASSWMSYHPSKGRGHMNHLNFGGYQPYLWNSLSYSHQILYTGRLCQVSA